MVKAMLSNEVRSIYAVPVTDPRSGWTASALAFRRALGDHFLTTVWEAAATGTAVAWVLLNHKADG